MKIFDCFTFNDELDLLELRLETLWPVVDRFIAVELPINFRQKEKPLHLTFNKGRFAKWGEKLRVHAKLRDFPTRPHPAIEHFQRRMIGPIVSESAEPDDLIMIGDVDEIPNPDQVVALSEAGIDHPFAMRQILYYYTVDNAHPYPWIGTVILPRGCVKAIDAENIREHRFTFPSVECGWHFSWLGSAKQIAKKIGDIDVQRDAKMHGSDDIVCPDPTDLAGIERIVSEGKDLFGRPITFHRVGIEPGVFQPVAIREWLDRFPQYASSEVVS